MLFLDKFAAGAFIIRYKHLLLVKVDHRVAVGAGGIVVKLKNKPPIHRIVAYGKTNGATRILMDGRGKAVVPNGKIFLLYLSYAMQ